MLWINFDELKEDTKSQIFFSTLQVFALKGEYLIALFLPLTVYRQIYELPHGSNPNARRLFDGNTMRFGVWTRRIFWQRFLSFPT